jgi:pimeloyl-ACP methyl ester carboxylesterase
VAGVAPPRPRANFLQAGRALLTEPVYFGLAQLTMMLTPRARTLTTEVPGGPAPLLLLHGLACNAGLWRWILPRLQAAGFAPIHVMNLEPLQADIDSLAGQVAEELQRIHRANPRARVTILAHSMGGLVARATLRFLDPAAIQRIVTVATPHHGAALARVMQGMPVAQMQCQSDWLAALNETQEGNLPVPVISIGSPEDNFVAPPSSTRLRGAHCIELRGLGHFGLLVSTRAMNCVLGALREPA